MEDPSMTKFTEQPQVKAPQFKDLLEKLKAKEQPEEEGRDVDYTSLSPNPVPSTETNIYNGRNTIAQRDLAYVEKHLNSCRTIISNLKGLLDGQSAQSQPIAPAWRWPRSAG
ncbi:uncharacterized protein LOC128243666 [Mya arenaria]|uniref:uncharacterized protein LOC128243666 n=1 Tax=Mya arenaria TaxID=6604 RepID=UPI0022E7F785|nr:uncharacterized protein LOC128243666 [Mya arenaria]